MHEDRLQELRACLALRHAPQLGARTWHALLEHYGSAREAVADARHWRSLGVMRAEVARDFLAGAWEGAAGRELDKVLAQDARVVLWADPEYPYLLRMIPDPPLVLYCKGSLDLLRGPAVAIVGSRKYVPEGMLAASRIGHGLSASGVTIVSGMALGIDREAHLAGLSGPGSSVAVLGTGLDRVYPARNVDVFQRLCEEGLVVTEFAPGTRPEAGNFPVRNRIVSGLSLGVVVAQAAKRSGSRITARLALEQGREVYAYVGPEDTRPFEGCRILAEEGAMPVDGAEAILADLAPRLRSVMRHKDAPPAPPAGRTRQARLDFGPGPQPPSAPPAASRPGAGSGKGRSGTAKGAAKSSAASSAASAASKKTAPVPSAAPQDPEQAAVCAALAGDRQVHIDALGRELGWDAAHLSRVLLLMEVEGLVRQWPGMRYSLA